MALLVATGLGQAAAAGVGANALARLFSPSAGPPVTGILLLVAAAVAVGALTASATVLGERLGQHYVHEIRLGLIRRSLSQGGVSSLGIAITRTSNDLNSVRNWIIQGIVPLAAGAPLLVGATAVLFALEPWLALGLLGPMVVLVTALLLLTPMTYHRTRLLRRARGRLSSHVADTLLATTAIRSAGGGPRELRRIDRLGTAMIESAISRSRVAGALRGAGAAASGFTTATIVGVAAVKSLPTPTAAAALSLVGLLAGPLLDLGRATEYRQAYRAARRIIGPHVEPGEPEAPLPAARPDCTVTDMRGLFAAGLHAGSDGDLPPLVASPGERIVLHVSDRSAASRVLSQFAGLGSPSDAQVLVDGFDLLDADPRTLRRLVGYAAQGMLLSHGSIARAALYRTPDASRSEVRGLLERVGLAERVAGLAKGEETILRHGGEPLQVHERAALLLARAVAGTPPLLVLDRLDADLGHAGQEVMRVLLRDYPGVVLLASDAPDRVVEPTLLWSSDGLRRVEAGSPPR